MSLKKKKSKKKSGGFGENFGVTSNMPKSGSISAEPQGEADYGAPKPDGEKSFNPSVPGFQSYLAVFDHILQYHSSPL